MKIANGIFFLLFLSLALPSFGQTPEKNKAACVSFYEAFNSRDYAKIGTLIADNFVDHALPPGMAEQTGLEGRDLFDVAIKEYISAFPDVKVSAIRYVAEGDYVMTFVSMSGTHKGNFAGIPPTGKSFNFMDADLIRFDSNGKAIEHWAVQDGSAMMMQLGVVPPGN